MFNQSNLFTVKDLKKTYRRTNVIKLCNSTNFGVKALKFSGTGDQAISS